MQSYIYVLKKKRIYDKIRFQTINKRGFININKIFQVNSYVISDR